MDTDDENGANVITQRVDEQYQQIPSPSNEITINDDDRSEVESKHSEDENANDSNMDTDNEEEDKVESQLTDAQLS